MPPLILSIEGNIGAGKSTFVTEIQDKLGHREDICFLQEPVEEWKTITDEDGKNILERFYGDISGFSFSFQMMAYITRLSNLKRAYENPKYKFIFTDRSLFTDKHVFAQMLYDDGQMNKIDYTIYNKWFHEFIDFSKNFKYIYLRTEPTTAYDRVLKRNRIEESIPLAYLEKCHKYHEKWLSNMENVHIVDGNHENTIEVVEQQISRIISSFISYEK